MSLEAGAQIAAGEGVDRFGAIENRGVDFIPAVERKSRPIELLTMFFGPQFGYGNLIFGSLPILFGLGWWGSFTSITVGSVVGSLIYIPMCLVSPRTGTNSQVSSGATFGVRGRLLGSGITLFISVGFFILLIWTAGEAVIATGARWFGTPQGIGSLSLVMGLLIAITCVSAILGHRTLERSLRIISPAAAIAVILLFVAFIPQFHAVHGGSYLLGTFWPTWFLAVTTSATLPISWGPFAGDYGRYIRADASPAKIAVYGGLGIFLGCWIAMVAAAFVSTAFVSQAGNFVGALTAKSPLWFTVPSVLVLGIASNIASSAMVLYNSALDIGSWPYFFRIKRWITSVIMSVIVMGLTYLLVVVVNVITSIEAFVTIMVVTATPWMVMVGLNYLFNRGRYNEHDLHAYAIPGHRGVYWFQGGLDARAMFAWAVGVVMGLLFSTTSFFTGALESSVGGVDLSWLVAGAVGGGLYAVLELTRPRAVAPAFAPVAAAAMADSRPLPVAPAPAAQSREGADMFQRILLAVDSSQNSAGALVAAVSAARVGGGDVRVVHVTDVEVFGRGGTVVSDEDDEASRLVNRIVGQLTASGVRASGTVRTALAGRIEMAIIDEATESKSTVIVMGSRGLSTLEGMFLGSTTQKVLHLAEIPVIVAR
ncbi:MAG: cytosine permease [Acidimicrobiales bacterium]